MFLAWESPWPAHNGAALRSLGILQELRKAFDVELIVTTRRPLSAEQTSFLGGLACSLTRIPLADRSVTGKVSAATLMLWCSYPYHCAVLQSSLQRHPEVLRRIRQFNGVVFTNMGHWGTLVCHEPSFNWILNQCDADVEFWRVYASQASNRWARLAALINLKFAREHYPKIYSNVGKVLCVCEEDRQQTLALAPRANVDIIENGVDCSYYTPYRLARRGTPTLLFTGTSVARNVTALQRFARDAFPLIQHEAPGVQLVVGGNFSIAAQAKFRKDRNIQFTGAVDDIRPIFNASDVFISPFEDAHGSKLKIAIAMAMAMPIVSTIQGIRGFPLVDGESVLLAHDKQQFAHQVVSLLKDPKRGERLGATAREAALSTIDWGLLGSRLVGIVEGVARTSPTCAISP